VPAQEVELAQQHDQRDQGPGQRAGDERSPDRPARQHDDQGHEDQQQEQQADPLNRLQ